MKQDVYMNRELSWLKFNERVLEEAEKEQIHQILKAVRKLNARIWKYSLTQRFCLFFHLRSWENVSRSHF